MALYRGNRPGDMIYDGSNETKRQVFSPVDVSANANTITNGPRPPVEEKDMATWAGGAKRSVAMPPWNMLPWKALRGWLTRFEIGLKYGLNNWKKTLSVPRDKWHDGEAGGESKSPEDKSALGFVRQFSAHAFEHWFQAMCLVDAPAGTVSPKGDDLKANMYAFLWNVGALVEYLEENEDMFREAFSQYPVGHPARRVDLWSEVKK